MLNLGLKSFFKNPLKPMIGDDEFWTPFYKMGALWLDGDLPTMTANGSGVVSQWNDKFGGGNNAVQGTGSVQPSNTGTLNSLPAVVFDEDFMTMNTEITGIRTVIIVTDALNGSDGSSEVASLFSGSGNTDSTFIKVNASDANFDISVDGDGSFSGTAKWCGNTAVSGKNINLGNTDAENKGPSVWVITYDQDISIDDIGQVNSSLELIGNIASLRAYTTVLDADDIAIQEGFEGHRYGLLANFPADHPYKTKRPTI